MCMSDRPRFIRYNKQQYCTTPPQKKILEDLGTVIKIGKRQLTFFDLWYLDMYLCVSRLNKVYEKNEDQVEQSL